MSKYTAIILLSVCAISCARMAYQLPAGANLLRSAGIQETFTCADLPYGYYADMDNDCEIFHVCLPISDENGELKETAQFSFMCGNQTIFSQESLTCTYPEEALPCEESRNLYEISNADFGKIDYDQE